MASYGRGEFEGIDSSYQSSNTGDIAMDHKRLAKRIGDSIQRITQNVAKIEKSVAVLGTNSDTDEFRESLHDTIHSTNLLARETNNSIKEYAHLPLPTNSAEQAQYKMQKERLAETFSAALSKFQRLQRTAAEKEKASVKRARAYSGLDSKNPYDAGFGKPAVSESQPVGYSQTREVLMMEKDVDLDIIKEREQSIKKLETDITDVNQIFKDLSMLVHEQGETLDSIEANIDSTQLHVQEGTQQLSKASSYQSKARRKKCCCVLILIIILIIVAIVLAVELSK